ncbi:MAG TPA: KpsF/GutQ family sugar-phosphate isomerase [Phycisphaerae bacterium]|nr:KpsF/GutQ family sugar-phosphate isomerase [Phycisphaerae bacterium]HPS52075.1 KpsF/GutQ family sugar-phosphate isomerase [Phycisphaerae bacterium]
MEKAYSFGRKVLELEGQAVLAAVRNVLAGDSFGRCIEAVLNCAGQVVLTGVGKAGIIGQKISATLASTGTPSIFLHPTEALHGDLGRVGRNDVVMAMSNSGSSEEIVRLLDHLKRRGVKIIGLTGKADSPLGRYADISLVYGEFAEACPLGAAPSVSTTVLLAVGDAVSLTVMELREFGPEDYAQFHPGGALGRKFLKVAEVMTSRDGKCCCVSESLNLRDALTEAENVGRRSGAILLVDTNGRLTGILTDADLRRRLLEKGAGILEKPVREIMTCNPKHIAIDSLASEAEAVLNKYRIDELPVVDGDGCPVGVLDVQDVLGLNTLK